MLAKMYILVFFFFHFMQSENGHKFIELSKTTHVTLVEAGLKDTDVIFVATKGLQNWYLYALSLNYETFNEFDTWC